MLFSPLQCNYISTGKLMKFYKYDYERSTVTIFDAEVQVSAQYR